MLLLLYYYMKYVFYKTYIILYNIMKIWSTNTYMWEIDKSIKWNLFHLYMFTIQQKSHLLVCGKKKGITIVIIINYIYKQCVNLSHVNFIIWRSGTY